MERNKNWYFTLNMSWPNKKNRGLKHKQEIDVGYDSQCSGAKAGESKNKRSDLRSKQQKDYLILLFQFYKTTCNMFPNAGYLTLKQSC